MRSISHWSLETNVIFNATGSNTWYKLKHVRYECARDGTKISKRVALIAEKKRITSRAAIKVKQEHEGVRRERQQDNEAGKLRVIT